MNALPHLQLTLTGSMFLVEHLPCFKKYRKTEKNRCDEIYILAEKLHLVSELTLYSVRLDFLARASHLAF